jgi:thiaminase
MKALLTTCVHELSAALDRFPWEQRSAYADWLAQTYYYVRHSTRLLAASAARFPFDMRGNALHHRFAAHMAEEHKHELLCTHDLRALETSLEAHPEHASTRMFYEPQYFKIEHQDPIVLFGYILPLEAIAPLQGKRVVEKVTAKFGVKCGSFLKVHAEEDVDHLEKALAMLAEVDEPRKKLIVQNLEQTSYAYVTLLEDIRRRES